MLILDHQKHIYIKTPTESSNYYTLKITEEPLEKNIQCNLQNDIESLTKADGESINVPPTKQD